MTNFRRFRAPAALVLTALLAGTAALTSAQTTGRVARASLRDPGDREVGRITFTDVGGGRTRVDVNVSGLPEGVHGWHVHVNGACASGADPATGAVIAFGAAGGHYDPLETMNHAGPSNPPQVAHGGDLPNITVSREGTGSLSFTTGKMSVVGNRLAVEGRSAIVHVRADDYKTDPAGESGGRIACGVIQLDGSSITARYVIPGSNVFPEGIAYDARRNAAYTGSTTNGDIWRVDLGTGRATPLAIGGSPGRTTAIGLELDPTGRLWAAGGATGKVAVVNTATGATERVLASPPSPQTFLNDLALAADGSVYVTDSLRPILFRVRPGGRELEAWLRFENTPVRYQAGLNLNGIVAAGRYLLTVQTNTGRLYRIDTRTKAVREVNLGGARLTNGDGLVLAGRTLHVLRNVNGQLDIVSLSADYSRGTVAGNVADPAFRFPTTGALANNRLLVVNGQLDRAASNPPPVLPFTIVALPIPQP